MLIMEGKDEEMEVNVDTQQDDESTWMESDQVMEDINEPNFKQVIH
jgi:hypothetical protein